MGLSPWAFFLSTLASGLNSPGKGEKQKKSPAFMAGVGGSG